jgi:hypothetical protein
VLRLKRDVGKENSIGMLATSYNFIDKHNQVLAFDGRFRLDKQTTVSFQTFGTTSRNFFFDPNDGENRYRTGNGFGYAADYNVSGRNWGWEFTAKASQRTIVQTSVSSSARIQTSTTASSLQLRSEPEEEDHLVSRSHPSLTSITTGRAGCTSGNPKTWSSCSCRATVTWARGGSRVRAFVRSRVWGDERSQADAMDIFSLTNKCTFYGESNERSSDKQHLSFYAGSNYSKKIQFNGQVTHRWGHFDLDFGNGSKYPRVSPAALALGQSAPTRSGSRQVASVQRQHYVSADE